MLVLLVVVGTALKIIGCEINCGALPNAGRCFEYFLLVELSLLLCFGIFSYLLIV